MAEAVQEVQVAAAWKDVTLLLLGALADEALQCPQTEPESFRKHVRDAIEVLQNAEESSQILMNAGGVIQAITHHSKRAQKEIDALLTDARDTAQMFLNHLDQLHHGAEAQPILARLRTKVEEALGEGQLGAARDAVLASLDELAQQAAHKRSESLDLTEKLQDRITVLEQGSIAKPIPAPPATVDATTGLPKRSEAEAALHRALDSVVESGPKFYAAAFYLHRMSLTNARFGEAIGNQVLLFCSQHLATTVLRANDSLFRWSGPAFVAILERPESESAVSGEIQRLISTPFSRFFETSSRSVYLPVKVTAEVVPLVETNFAEVSNKLERFILASTT